MSWNQVLETLGTGAAGSIIGGAGWTKQAFVADWARNGSGLIVPGESYATAIRRTTEMPSADMAVEGQVNAAAHGELNHTLLLRADSAVNNDANLDRIYLAAGPELWFDGNYVKGYGQLGWTFSANPTIRAEAQGNQIRFYINGTLIHTFTDGQPIVSGGPNATIRPGGVGSNYAGFRSRSQDEWQALRIYEWQDDPGPPPDDGMHVGLLLTPP